MSEIAIANQQYEKIITACKKIFNYAVFALILV